MWLTIAALFISLFLPPIFFCAILGFLAGGPVGAFVGGVIGLFFSR